MANRPPPLDISVDTNGVRISIPWSQWLQQLSVFISHVTDYTEINLQVPLTGFSIAMTPTDKVLMLKPAGVLATGTVVLPASPYDGQSVQISSTKTITGFTLSPNDGETVFNAPTTLVGGSGFHYFYRATDNSWYRLN